MYAWNALRQPINLGEPVSKCELIVDYLQKTKKEYKNLKKQKINNISIKTS